MISLPPGGRLLKPLHIIHIAAAGGAAAGGAPRTLAVSAPRLLLALGRGAEAEVIEEYVSAAGADTAVFSVSEALLETGAQLRTGYVQREAPGSVHFKASLVSQAEGSSYSLVEARVGGGLSRHDLGISQGGPETVTRMRHFLLAGEGQLQDLHSKLVLDHPRGEADQLHKCIVSHATGRGVFDGNVQVRGRACVSRGAVWWSGNSEGHSIPCSPCSLLLVANCNAAYLHPAHPLLNPALKHRSTAWPRRRTPAS